MDHECYIHYATLRHGMAGSVCTAQTWWRLEVVSLQEKRGRDVVEGQHTAIHHHTGHDQHPEYVRQSQHIAPAHVVGLALLLLRQQWVLRGAVVVAVHRMLQHYLHLGAVICAALGSRGGLVAVALLVRGGCADVQRPVALRPGDAQVHRFIDRESQQHTEQAEPTEHAAEPESEDDSYLLHQQWRDDVVDDRAQL